MTLQTKDGRKTHVLHITHSLGLGGAQVVLKGICEHSPSDINPFILSLKQKDAEVDVNIPATNIFQIASSSGLSITPVIKAYKIVRGHQIDIIHCHMIARSILISILLKLIFWHNIKLVFHEHGMIFGSDTKSKISDKLYVAMVKISRPFVSRYVAVSKATSHLLRKRAKIKSKIITLYNFVDETRFNPEALSRSEVDNFKTSNNLDDESKFKVGFAARLIERKGWLVFLKAAKEICKTNDDFVFYISGDGADRAKLEKWIRDEELNEKVKYLGYQKNMPAFYANVDCFVIPSHWEPMGLTELEAQSMGKAVIASDVDGLNEVIDNGVNALTFKSKDYKELSQKIIELYGDSILRDKLVSEGIKNSHKYSVYAYTKELSKIYKS